MKYFGEAPVNIVTKEEIAEPVEDPIVASLSDEQKAVLEEVKAGHSIVVDSVIGSGKTRTLQAVCNTFSHSRILYLTYNRLLKIDAQEKIKNRNVTVQNYHGFVYKYLVRKNLKVEPSKQIRTFLDKCSDVPLIYDIICIDEYQDIEEDTADLLLYIAKECPNAQWIFVGDMAQKIYDKTRIDVYKDCIEKIIPNYVPMAFTQSFRISPEHANFLSDMWSKKIVGVNKNSTAELVTNFGQILDVLDATPNKDLLILGPRYGFTQELVNMLERHNPRKYNKETMWASISDRDEHFKIKPDSLIVTTYDGCKGMERSVCIVIDWTDTHFKTRVEKPFTNQNIIRNLFCVAASRGKEKILFYLDGFRNRNGGCHILSQKDLTLSYTQELPNYEPSNMFDFKYAVDINRCLESVKIEKIEQEDTSEIETVRADANIDLSPTVGIYQEVTFFKNYDFEKVLSRLEPTPMLDRLRRWISDHSPLTDERKALVLTAYSTELYRYVQQATDKFISPEEHERLLARLGSKIDANSKNIQVPCHIVKNFTANGYMDYVDKDKIPWELKFVGTLSNSNILQTAMYQVMSKAPYAYLWNTRNNDLRKITVTNKEKFLDDVYTCITMGRKLRRN